MTCTLEVAFDMIQNCMLSPNQSIVGLYEAALPMSLPNGQQLSTLAQYVCEMIQSNFKDAIFVQIKADLPSTSDTQKLS